MNLYFLADAKFWVASVPILAFLFKFWQYVDIRKREVQQQDFDNYHSILAQLNGLNHDSNYPKLDLQLAAIFELRFYKRYKTLTKKILMRWKQHDYYKEEIEDTLKILGVERNGAE